MALGTFTLTGTWTQANGLAPTGSIVITPTFPVVDAAGNLLVAKVPYEVTLDSGGAISVTLPVISEAGEAYTYHVKEMIDDQQVSPGVYTRSYTIAIPADAAGDTLDVADLIDASATEDTVPTYGIARLLDVVTKSGAHVLVRSDEQRLILMNAAANITVPPEADVPFPVGVQVHVCRYGAGAVALVEGSGVNITATPSLNLRAQGSGATLIYLGEDEWLAMGDFA